MEFRTRRVWSTRGVKTSAPFPECLALLTEILLDCLDFFRLPSHQFRGDRWNCKRIYSYTTNSRHYKGKRRRKWDKGQNQENLHLKRKLEGTWSAEETESVFLVTGQRGQARPGLGGKGADLACAAFLKCGFSHYVKNCNLKLMVS